MPGQPRWATGKGHCVAGTGRPPITLAVWHITREVRGDPGAAAPSRQAASWGPLGGIVSGIFADLQGGA